MPLPPSLPSSPVHIGTANECQFIFSVQEFYMIQKLRGTVTYMIKVQYGLSVCVIILYATIQIKILLLFLIKVLCSVHVDSDTTGLSDLLLIE